MNSRPSMPEWGAAQPESEGNVFAQLVRGAGVDMNNALTAILGNLALAERHAAGNQKLIKLLDNIRAATERGNAVSRQLLALAPGGAASAMIPTNGMTLDEDPDPASGRILVVEDDPHVAEVAVAVLEDMGHEVELRGDAPSALALLEGGAAFDLVFSDIVMPGGMSGIELAERIVVSFPRLPVLLATGYSTAALAPGAMRFPVLAKPYSVKELARRVTQMLPVAG